jgi:hypothetical protein
MRKEFYKLDEYSGKLPNPRLFPAHEADIVAIEGYPDAFSDGFMADLSVKEEDKERLKKLVTRTSPKPIFDGQLDIATRKATILLSEPQYIYDGWVFITYVLTASNIESVGIQVRYYQYFRNRYPSCGFFTSDDWMGIKSIRLEDKIVGLWMPVMLPPRKEG